MNKYDIQLLKLNWEIMRNKLKNSKYKYTLNVSSSCYAQFGTCGISIFKYFKNKWHRKIINYWKELSFNEFIIKFNEEEWEMV